MFHNKSRLGIPKLCTHSLLYRFSTRFHFLTESADERQRKIDEDKLYGGDDDEQDVKHKGKLSGADGDEQQEAKHKDKFYKGDGDEQEVKHKVKLSWWRTERSQTQG